MNTFLEIFRIRIDFYFEKNEDKICIYNSKEPFLSRFPSIYIRRKSSDLTLTTADSLSTSGTSIVRNTTSALCAHNTVGVFLPSPSVPMKNKWNDQQSRSFTVLSQRWYMYSVSFFLSFRVIFHRASCGSAFFSSGTATCSITLFHNNTARALWLCVHLTMTSFATAVCYNLQCRRLTPIDVRWHTQISIICYARGNVVIKRDHGGPDPTRFRSLTLLLHLTLKYWRTTAVHWCTTWSSSRRRPVRWARVSLLARFCEF